MGTDVPFMERAISLARSSQPLAGINPPVGAVLVRDGVVVGQGFHRGPGTLHAEAAALLDARASIQKTGESLAGATLYCSLEPCCHHGGGKRTPPCTEAIIAAGVSRVVFASWDPNPRVSGKGAARLREAGVFVEQGLLADKADGLIEAFSASIRLGRPFIRIKWAQSLDGRLACKGGVSRWITNSQARVQAHVLRSYHDAVMVGAGTLRADDPELTVRDAPVRPELGSRQPIRIIVAGREPLPLGARVFSPALADQTMVLAARSSPVIAQCRLAGVRVRDIASTPDGLPDLLDGLRALYADGIGSILVEGGSRLITAFLARGLWDAVAVFTAPLILGQGIEAVGNLGIESPGSGIKLMNARFQAGDGFIRLDAQNPAACAGSPAVGAQEESCLRD